MYRFLLIALSFLSISLPISAFGSSFCIVNDTENPVWLSLTQVDALHRGKLVFPKTEMCSTYQTKRTLFISVAKRNGAATQCHQTLEPGAPAQLFLERMDPKTGCTWNARTSAQRPIQKSRSSLLCSVLAKDKSVCNG